MKKAVSTAVILAAGGSSRMGTPKALLKKNGKTFLKILVSSLRTSGIEDIRVVLGAGAAGISEHITAPGICILINKSWQDGQLSSFKTALKDIGSSSSSVMLCLIDSPFTGKDTIMEIIDAYKKSDADIAVPLYKGRGGHPVIFSSSTYKALLEAPLEEGARYVVRSGRFKVLRVEVDDKHVLDDIDSPREYKESVNE